MPSDLDPLVNQSNAAQYLGLSARTLEGWRLHGGGPRYIKAGRSVRYRVIDLTEWLAAQTRVSTSDLGSKGV